MRAILSSLLIVAFAAPASAGTLLVGNKSDDTVDLIDLTTGRSYATLPTGNAPHEVAVSPDGRTAVVTDYGDRGAPGSSLTVIDLAEVTVLRTIDLGEHTRPHGIVWLSDDRLTVTTEGSAHLLVVDPHTGEIVSAVETGQRISHMVAVTPDGARAFVANIGSGSVTAIDLVTGEKLADIATGDGAEGIDVTPDGGEVWVTNRSAGTLSVIDPETLEILATVECPGFPIRIKIAPDGGLALVSAAESGEVAVIDLAERREVLRRQLDLTKIPDDEGRLFAGRFGESPVPVGIVIAPDGETAWVAATQSDAVVAIAPETLEVKAVLTAGQEPDGMAFSPRRREAEPASDSAAPTPTVATDTSGLDGRELFVETHKCQLCHGVPAADLAAKVKSEKMKGPDLGGATEVDFATMAAYLRKSGELDGAEHNKEFKGSDEELLAIFAWLAENPM